MKKIYTKGLASLVVTLAKKQTSKKIGFVAGLLLAFGMSAFSQTNYYVRYDSVNARKAIIKNKLDQPTYWTTDPSGIGGTCPADFTTAGQIFHVQATGYSVNAPLVISGAGSKLVVGSDTATVANVFTLSNIAAFSGTIDIVAKTTVNTTLTINQANTSTITLGTLGVGSTVRYGGNLFGDVQKVIAANYYNLSLAPTAATYASVTLPASTIGVAGIFTSRVANVYGSTINFNGGDGQVISGGTYYNLTISGNKTVPDSLTGVINIAGAFSDNTTGAATIPFTKTMSRTGVVSEVASTINYLGLNPQAQTFTNTKTYYNVSFSDGVPLPVTAISGNTITLAQANADLKIGQKVNTNTFTTTFTRGKPTGTAYSNSILLDTSATITSINDTVITLSSPLKLRLFVQHSTTGGLVDTVYATSFDAATQSITLETTPPSTYTDSSSTVIGSNILLLRGQIFPATTYISSVSGNVLTASKPLVSINNMGVVSIGNNSSAPAAKTLSGNLHLVGIGALNSTVPLVTDGSTVSLDGTGNRIGGGANWAYNNLVINQVTSAYNTVVLSPSYINGTLTIQSGKVTSTGAARHVILNESASFPAPSVDTNYVSCPLAKKFNSTTPFTYYLGGSFANAASPRTVTITPKTADAKTYLVSFAPAKTPNSTKIDSTTINIIDTLSNYNVVLSGYTAGADTAAKLSFSFVPSSTFTDSNLVLGHYFQGFYTAESAPLKYTGSGSISFTTTSYDTTFGRYVFGTAGPIIVPVKLSGVVATALVNKTIKVNWSSANEVNVGKYVVEGSVDGVKFSAKGTIAAKGSSSYSFVDATPSAGVNYYRIKVIDIDGKVIYSSIVSAKQAATINNISVNPNPVKNKQLSFVLSNDAASYTLKVTNILGKTVVAKTIAHAGGTASYNVSLPTSASAGTYFVEVSNGNSKTTKTIVVE